MLHFCLTGQKLVLVEPQTLRFPVVLPDLAANISTYLLTVCMGGAATSGTVQGNLGFVRQFS
jgi:hypothetical protein